ncbi:DUF5011 domain-containing protein [Sulfidibacter corallicola]|uniref:DUF5011 domain-containing protein n=1 Tax=Sulfidibacter corallicola TaxID=2818388 RepID=A0A8A4TRS7_SULCO|nr:DUF5011 domain-containing protein [Sulfidibacter corallicola]QTD51711.1 DUF5011 domain-containing protein [Sulfidibacter corallicola]
MHVSRHDSLALFLLWGMLTGLPLVAGERIVLAPHMVSLERGLGDPGLMVDEQDLIGDPRATPGPSPQTRWLGDPASMAYPYRAVIDLGREYELEALYLYDGASSGKVVFEFGEAGTWRTFYGDKLDRDGIWIGRPLQITTRYLRLSRGAGIFEELALYGTAVDAPQPLQRIPVSPGDVTLVNGHGDAGHMVDEQDLVGNLLEDLSPRPTSIWHTWDGQKPLPHHAIIDLGRPWRLRHLFLFDMGATGDLIFATGSPQGWQELVRDPLTAYRQWTRHDVDRVTRYLRVTRTTAAKFAEIALYGEPVRDRQAPTVRIQGPETVKVARGDFYYDLGVTAEDDLDGDVGDRVVAEGVREVDVDRVGDYAIDYRVCDSSDNCTVARRTVQVREGIRSDIRREDLTPEQHIDMEWQQFVWYGDPPPQDHPRLFGTNDAWMARMEPLNQMPCVPGRSGLGRVYPIKTIWDRATLGGSPCNGTMPRSIDDHPDARFYFGTGGVNAKWDRSRGFRVLHLLRRLLHWHATGAPAPYTEAEMERLLAAFLDTEMVRFPTEKFHAGADGSFFDLGAEASFAYWCAILDIYWHRRDHLTPQRFDQIKNKLDSEIDSFLEKHDEGHWSQWNGNNWSPRLALPAITYALTFYYEEPRAAEVLKKALRIIWLHREYFAEDGSHLESYNYGHAVWQTLFHTNLLMKAAFGRRLESVHWDRMPAIARALARLIAPEGNWLDFGDTWNDPGVRVTGAYLGLIAEEVWGDAPVGSISPDPCLVKAAFQNQHFESGLQNPFLISPSMARDWAAIVNDCPTDPTTRVEVDHFPDSGVAALRQFQPGKTASGALPDFLHGEQADQSYLAISAVPNHISHRELDFGALSWVAHGSRLLYDFGYCRRITKHVPGEMYSLTHNYDNTPSAANTLVVPDAKVPGIEDTDTSQIFGETGSLAISEQGGFRLIEADGDRVYGADHELGWLQRFRRWLIALDDGAFLVVDHFRLKSDRPASRVAEHWYTRLEPDFAGCTNIYGQHVVASGEDQRIWLEPSCNTLAPANPVESVGAISGAALHPGRFQVDDAPIQIVDSRGGTASRLRFRWIPDAAVSEDTRLFVLQSDVSRATIQPARVQVTTEGQRVVGRVTWGSRDYRIELDTHAAEPHLIIQR